MRVANLTTWVLMQTQLRVSSYYSELGTVSFDDPLPHWLVPHPFCPVLNKVSNDVYLVS